MCGTWRTAQRFGFREEEILEAVEIPLGRMFGVCPECGKETAAERRAEQTQGSKIEEGSLAPQTR